MRNFSRHGAKAQIRRFTNNLLSKNFGKYFIEIQEDASGSHNPDEFFETEELAILFLEKNGFIETKRTY
jgi:hypothetical protein